MRAGDLAVPREEIAAAAGRVSPKLLDAMRFALKRIQRTQGQLLSRLPFSYVADGYVIRCVVRPLESVGCYIPGGRAVVREHRADDRGGREARRGEEGRGLHRLLPAGKD